MKTLTLAFFGSFTLGLLACGGDDGPADSIVDESQGLTPVSWRACGISHDRDVRCAEVTVPVDYANPDGPTVEISLNRISADASVPYRGVLFVNPGGPGGSGKDFALNAASAGMFDALAPGFDVVGFDPRGVADSGERTCAPAPSMQPEIESAADYIDSNAAEGQRCASTWGPLFGHLGSNQVVHDMETMRQALGEPKLNFLGISYGTRLGALYAHTFPESAGLIVLDAAMAPDMDLMKETRAGFAQLLVLQDVFFQDCDAGVLSCPPDARELFDDMMAAANELGLGVQIASYWANDLSYQSSREELPLLLEYQASEPNTDWLIDLATGPGLFDSIGVVANQTVTCIDATTAPPTAAEVEALYSELYTQSPVFAFKAGTALMCSGWPITRDPVPMPSAPTATPQLVIGGTQDLLTPLSNAEELTTALGNATLLISNHYGHSAIGAENGCVNNAIYNYFARAELPAPSTVCDQAQ